MDAGNKNKKKPHPREHANIFSALFFLWTLPTFSTGYKRDLEVEDLFEPLNEHRSDRLGDRLVKHWDKELVKAKAKNRRPSLTRCLIKCFGFEFLLYGLVLLIFEIGMRVMQPLALGHLILYYSTGSTVTETEAYLYAGGVILCSFLNVVSMHPYMMGILHVGMKIRVACCSLIYRKSLRLSKTALGETTAGQVVNLLSNDVNRFDVAVIFLHMLWVGPLETVVVTYFLYQEVGISAVIGVAVLLAFIPIQAWLGKQTSILRLKTAIRTDERVRLMNEIISGIQVIKMYTWEKPFEKLVSVARRNEIKKIMATSYIRGVVLSFIMFTTRISIFASILAYVLLGNYITAEQVFVLTSYYNILRQTMTVFFPQGIAQYAEAKVSITRLENYMLYDEIQLSNKIPSTKHNDDDKKKSVNETIENPRFTPLINDKIEDKRDMNGVSEVNKAGIIMKNVTAKWTDLTAENTLSNLNINVTPGRLLAVIGPVGSGKSSLLQTILKELPLKEGFLAVNGSVSYASQEPWLFAGSVRQNILFGEPLDKKRYREVVKKCALERDFSLFPYGDQTIVGERGVSLSGGQRARINLARAVYRKADIYLLDDPLSAVDTHVGKHLFDDCISSYLRDKTCILVTHQLQYLKDVDHIIILNNGNVEAEGTFTELKASGLDFAKLLHAEHNSETDDSISPVRKRNDSVQSVTSSIEDSKLDIVPVQEPEQKASGTVSSYVYKEYFKAGGNCCVLFILFILFFLSQLSASGGDYFITYWVNLEEIHTKRSNLSDAVETNNGTVGPIVDFSRETCIYIFAGITIATVILSLLRAFAFFNVSMRASMNLHNNMFASITRATMRFFNTNSSGRILNRFSKDMGAIDELLPAALIDCLQIGLALLGIIIVVAIVNYWLLLPTVVIGIIFYFIRIYYLSTSRSVKRMEGTTRSPVFSHLNASLQGLTTIRAFQAEKILIQEFDNHQDLHSSAWYLFIASSRAFGFWLDLICIIYISIVTLSFLVLGNETFGGNVGLAITQSIGLTGMFQWGMRQSTELENQMTSVERVLEYRNVEREPALETPPDKKPPKEWPQRGHIQFKDVYLLYSPNEPPVLKNLNFVIMPKEKIGIVGRTGAGKTSLIAALFRLTDIEGTIFIDDVDTMILGLHDLRSKISIIPQEPVLFSGTLRKNLDPFDEFSDDLLWQALEEVELKEAVNELTAGLNSKMSEGGSNFSVGQRQLVCLARAIVRNNKILILDEATANVDPQTDALIQHTIRRKFITCTVLTIAHRLHTVMDCDKVLVMDAGRMVEFSHPHILLQNPDGVFTGMVNKTGKVMADALIKIAEQTYRKINHTEKL